MDAFRHIESSEFEHGGQVIDIARERIARYPSGKAKGRAAHDEGDGDAWIVERPLGSGHLDTVVSRENKEGVVFASAPAQRFHNAPHGLIRAAHRGLKLRHRIAGDSVVGQVRRNLDAKARVRLDAAEIEGRVRLEKAYLGIERLSATGLRFEEAAHLLGRIEGRGGAVLGADLVEGQPSDIVPRNFVLDVEQERSVAGVMQNMTDVALVIIQCPVERGETEVHQAVALRITPCQHRRAARATDRHSGEIVGHPDAIGGQGVDVRRMYRAVGVTAEVSA